jgi:histidinol-phosphate aminotransferase
MSAKTIETKKSIYDILPYVGGKSGNDDKAIKLSSNEGPFGPSQKVIDAVQKSADKLHLYPDGGCYDLRHALSKKNNITADNIVCGAGSDEIISLLCNAYVSEGDEVVYSEHGFLMYPISTRAAGGTPVAVSEKDLKAHVDGLLAAVTDKTKIVFIANPNNPTGSYLKKDEIKRLHDGLPDDVLLVLDAAYTEYVDEPDYTDGHEWVEGSKNIIVTRTFSKIYGLGGLRLGWGHMPDHVADILNRIRGPFNVSSIAQVAGLAALSDDEFVEKSVLHNKKCGAKTKAKLEEMGFTVYPSVANFLLVECDTSDRADGICEHLKNKNIFIRQMGGYGLPTCLRVSIGTQAQMNLVLSAISDYINA